MTGIPDFSPSDPIERAQLYASLSLRCNVSSVRQYREFTVDEVEPLLDHLKALLAELTTLRAENERLRLRTHEIQEAADKKMAKLQSDVAHHQRCRDLASDAVAAYGADWAGAKGEPGTLFSYSSANTRDAFTGLIERGLEAEAQLTTLRAENERLRQNLREWASELSRLDAQTDELSALRAVVKLADALYVAARQKAQKDSDERYMDEFGIQGPSLAGFLPGGADRDYHYARHTAGECPDPSHACYMDEAALSALPAQPGEGT